MVTHPPFTSALSRRHWLHAAGGGLAALGVAGAIDAAERRSRGPHEAPRAKRIIHLFMNGGPFQADLFDPKPAINQFAGQRPAAVQFRTENATGGLLAVPFAFKKHGESG